MDINFIKEKIYGLDEQRKIQPREYLSAEVISLLREGTTTTRVACFAPTSSHDKVVYPSEVTCSHCKKQIVKELTKTALFEYLKGYNKLACENCQKQIDDKKKKEEEESVIRAQKFEQEKIINTQKYIDEYLDPNKSWDDDIHPKDRMSLLTWRQDLNYEPIADYIKNMPYKEFLKTPFWYAISAYKKYKEEYKCALCGSNKQLATHHRTYERHGQEYKYTVINEDLIVLCSECHGKFHDRI